MRIMQRIDDLDYAQDKTETVLAPGTGHVVRITWQVDGGPVREGMLDLSDKNLELCSGPVEMMLAAAQPGSPRASEPRPAPVLPMGTKTESRRYRRDMKTFADQYHIRALTPPDRPVYETPSGARYWPTWFERVYTKWLQTGDIELPKRPVVLDGNPVIPDLTEDEADAFVRAATGREESDADLHGDRAAR